MIPPIGISNPAVRQRLACQPRQPRFGMRRVESARDVSVGQETVKLVNAGRSTYLNGTTVLSHVDAGRDVSMDNGTHVHGRVNAGRGLAMRQATVEHDVSSGRSAEVDDSQLHRNLDSGRDAKVSNSTVKHRVNASNNLTLKDNTTVGRSVEAGKNATLTGTVGVKGDLSAGRNVTLSDSVIVGGNVSAGRSASIADAAIGGSLEAPAIETLQDTSINKDLKTAEAHLKLSNVAVENIILEEPQDESFGSVHVTGDIFNSVIQTSGNSITRINGGSLINGKLKLNNGGSAEVDGYKITCRQGQTTVVTPEGYQYVNGDLKHGEDAPENFAEYRLGKLFGPPKFAAPGWKDEGSGQGASENDAEPKAKIPTQTVTLDGHTHVRGNITFETGYGKVFVGPDARFDGKIIGQGEVEAY